MGNLFKSKREFIAAFKEKYEELEGREFPEKADVAISYVTLLRLFREKINVSWIDTGKKYAKYNERQIYYFSMEFLIGRLLKYYLVNLDIQDIVEAGLEEMGINYEELLEQEADPGTGNGGLGRLAACLLDSMAHMGMAGHGNGMRYRFGLFNQKIVNGYQMELPDNWLKNGYPWERCKREKAVIVKFNGDIVYFEENGSPKFTLENYQPVLAVPYDIPMIGMKDTLNINNLRLWSAEPVEEEMDMTSFNTGNFAKAMQYQSKVEAISYILYPDDRYPSGRELRLKQEYLIVSAGIQSIIRYQKKNGLRIQNLSRKVGLHINDTHPALCVPELMRILLDEENLSWDQAWIITNNTISYTNHTILPEALEKWPVGLVRSLLPRVYQIIEEIDRRYIEEINLKFDGKAKGLLDKTAIVRDGYVHMACLAIIGSYSVNGVAKLHSKILKENIFPEFNRIYPGKFTNITNGVSHRRFLFSANPTLSDLITSKIGDEWREKAADLISLKNFENDKEFLEQINNDTEINDKIKVIFLENFNVTLGEIIYPAAEISEQISTASQEASGTGNMKFMFNGAVTLGTLDGANVEILEAVGSENIRIFGITAEEVMEMQKSCDYLSKAECETNPRLKKVLNQLIDGYYGL